MGDIATASATLKARKDLSGNDTIKYKNLVRVNVETIDDLLNLGIVEIAVKEEDDIEYFEHPHEYLEDYYFCNCYTYYIVKDEFKGNKELFEKLKNNFDKFVIIDGVFETNIEYIPTLIYCETDNERIKEVNLNKLKKCLDLDMEIDLEVNGSGANC